jgi:hypothetical protein
MTFGEKTISSSPIFCSFGTAALKVDIKVSITFYFF